LEKGKRQEIELWETGTDVTIIKKAEAKMKKLSGGKGERSKAVQGGKGSSGICVEGWV